MYGECTYYGRNCTGRTDSYGNPIIIIHIPTRLRKLPDMEKVKFQPASRLSYKNADWSLHIAFPLHMIHLFYRPVIVKVRYGTIYFRHGTVPYGTCTEPQFNQRHKLALAGIELATRLNLYSLESLQVQYLG